MRRRCGISRVIKIVGFEEGRLRSVRASSAEGRGRGTGRDDAGDE